MISNRQKNIAQKALQLASSKGCKDVQVSLLKGINNSFEYRDTQLDNLHQSTENKLYIELYIANKYASFSTNRVDENELDEFITNGIQATLHLSEDKYRQLPNIKRCYTGNEKTLDIFDASYSNIDTTTKINIAQQVVEEVLANSKQVISTSAMLDDTLVAEYMIASNGLEVESLGTSFSLSSQVSLKTQSEARAESYWAESSIYWHHLDKTNIGKTALERAKRKIGQRKIQSGRYHMLLDNTVSSRLLMPMIASMAGAALQQKNSFLIDKLGQQITATSLTLKDTPHLTKSFGARMFDNEGVATADRTIIENGILSTYFIDTYHGLKMEVEPTISSPSILCPTYGNKNLQQIITSLDKGIWVTGFNGGNVNPTTGDFSFGVEGLLIENGETTIPIGEMNITGNLLVVWSNLVEIGNDPRLTSRSRMPALLFEAINFSGL